MSVRYDIKAQIIDIQADSPQTEDIFLVDTNVWYWYVYTRASILAQPHQTQVYPSYVNKVISASSHLFYCGLSLVELVHNIERSERNLSQITGTSIKPKEYRHNYTQERANVVSEIQLACSQIKAVAKEAEILVNNTTTTQALNRLPTQLVDGYDLLILEAMQNNNIEKIITDDGDYTTVPNIQVFTANRNVIIAARNQGKLITR